MDEFVDLEAQPSEGPTSFQQTRKPFRIKVRFGTNDSKGWANKTPAFTADQMRGGVMLRITCPECQHYKDMIFRLARDPGTRNEWIPLTTSLPNFKCSGCGKSVFAHASAVHTAEILSAGIS